MRGPRRRPGSVPAPRRPPRVRCGGADQSGRPIGSPNATSSSTRARRGVSLPMRASTTRSASGRGRPARPAPHPVALDDLAAGVAAMTSSRSSSALPAAAAGAGRRRPSRPGRRACGSRSEDSCGVSGVSSICSTSRPSTGRDRVRAPARRCGGYPSGRVLDGP